MHTLYLEDRIKPSLFKSLHQFVVTTRNLDSDRAEAQSTECLSALEKQKQESDQD